MESASTSAVRRRGGVILIASLLASAVLVLWLAGETGGAGVHGSTAHLVAESSEVAPSAGGFVGVVDAGPRRSTAVHAGAQGEGGAAEAPDFGEVVIRVFARDGRVPVAGAYVWTVPSHSKQLITGADGTVRFRSESRALIAGVTSAEGHLRWEPMLEPDAQPGEPGSHIKDEVTVSMGEATTIDLFVRLGAVIRGTLSDEVGDPVTNRRFFLARAKGNDWSCGEVQLTDELGRFEIRGLRPDWYLVGYDPKARDVFPYEKVRADWGSVHELHLQFQPEVPVAIEVAPTGIAPDEPWEFGLSYKFVRDDSMTVAPSRRRLSEAEWESRQPPRGVLIEPGSGDAQGHGPDVRPPRGIASIEVDLSEGPYLLELHAIGRPPMPPGAVWWIGGRFTRTLPFEVDAKGNATFEGSLPPHRAEVSGMDEVSYLRAHLIGSEASLFVRKEGQNMNQILYSHRLRPDENGQVVLNAAVDPTRIASSSLIFHAKSREQPERFVGQVTLVPGLQELTLYCAGKQDE